ncbi:MAG: hypothetical protein NTW47_18225 [Proteobacteria bacterium]|nr:hypothetical protein [Pseudomonadota bacterium]
MDLTLRMTLEFANYAGIARAGLHHECLDIHAHCLYNYSPATRYARCPVRINLSRRYAAGYSVLMCNQDVSACMHYG